MAANPKEIDHTSNSVESPHQLGLKNRVIDKIKELQYGKHMMKLLKQSKIYRGRIEQIPPDILSVG